MGKGQPGARRSNAAVPLLNRFPKEIEQLAPHWARTDTSGLRWKFEREMAKTDSRPFEVSAGALRGVAKPGKSKGENPCVHRAAHEKIGADLAYHLQLPVPPVTLWKRDDRPDPPEPYVCVSAWAFPACDTWKKWHGRLSAEEKQTFSEVLGGMQVFETWISAEDRKEDHVLLEDVATNEVTPRIAFIDYAFAMSKVWKSPDDGDGPRRFGLSGVTPDPEAAREMVDRINALDASLIEEIVRRIPKGYWSLRPEMAPDNAQEVILSNLLKRRSRLGTLLNL